MVHNLVMYQSAVCNNNQSSPAEKKLTNKQQQKYFWGRIFVSFPLKLTNQTTEWATKLSNTKPKYVTL